MRSGSTGLHSGAQYENCISCHSEHHGEDYDLITWPNGEANFQHDVVDYEMMGAHLELDCRQCHNVKNVVDPGKLRSWHKEFGRTWLGLAQDCLTCHQDPHAGALTAEQSCLSCHDTLAWQPATGFDHAKAAFRLTGLHGDVACVGCHTTLEKPVRVGSLKVATAKFKPQAHESCASCHADPHANTLGPRCTDCHTTLGWLQINGDKFDHGQTRYPLVGLHAELGCVECHGGGRKKPEFAACSSCHGDSHESVRLQKPQLIECQSCHDVEGFRPAHFTIDQHAALAFPLRGSHQATACLACHEPLAGPPVRAANLAPRHNSCTDCHRDPHGGETAAAKMQCLACHQETTWRAPQFDHRQTGFALAAAHAAVQCTACHQPDQKNEVLFSQESPDCASCHDDVHGGNLVGGVGKAGQVVSCATCHVTTDWFAENFDHEVHSRFSLVGGHEDVACKTCHISASQTAGEVPVFKPLPTDCLTCHGNSAPELTPTQKGKS